MKIIYIAGYGRSGSTLLEGILNNYNETISVGECYRFFKRYYEGNSVCGCNKKIKSCNLWAQVDKELKMNIPDYNPDKIWEQIIFLLKFKNRKKINEIIKNTDWRNFRYTIILFYKAIQKYSKKNIIIDSSKSIGWLKIIYFLDFAQIKIIHLERSLIGVANSWKKKVKLIEYKNSIEFMPMKSPFLVVKEWYKIKWTIKHFKTQNYMYLNYETWINDFDNKTKSVLYFLDFKINKPYLFLENHAIGGNPMRKNDKTEIIISTKNQSYKNLSSIEKIFIRIAEKIDIII